MCDDVCHACEATQVHVPALRLPIVVADVTSVHAVGDSLHQQIKDLTGATSLQLRTSLDDTVLGGVRIDIPGKRFDGTIRRKLNALKAQQL